MAAVLAIHATQPAAAALLSTRDALSADALAVLLNQACRFCVPLFLLLSGLGLAARERQRLGRGLAPTGAGAFYADRLGRLALPFALWSLIYLLVDAPWRQGAGAVVASVLRPEALVGGAQYHLYFVAIILQCYALFPLLARLRSRWWLALSFAVAALWSAPAHELLSAAGLARPDLPSWTCPAWLCWFHLGMRAGSAEGGGAPATAGRRLGAAAAVAAALALVLVQWWHDAGRMPDPGWFDHFNRWTVMLYVAACWLALCAWDAPVARWLAASPRRSRILAWLVGTSFAVYLGHPLILRAIHAWLPGLHPLGAVPILAAAALAAAGALGAVLARTPRLARALGW